MNEHLKLPPLPQPLQQCVRSTFATPLVNILWPESDNLNNGLLEIIESLRQQPSDARSVVGGWHSNTRFLDRQEPAVRGLVSRLRSLERELASAFLNHDEQGALPRTRVEGWANVLPPGGYHIPHSHPNAFWSGVYYVNGCHARDGDSDAGKLELLDPRTGAALSHVVDSPLYGRLLITPQPGRMVAFPSWLTHFVHPNGGDEDRITVAFNIMIETAPRQGMSYGAD